MATRRQGRSIDRAGRRAQRAPGLSGPEASPATSASSETAPADIETHDVETHHTKADDIETNNTGTNDFETPVAEPLMESVSPEALLSGQDDEAAIPADEAAPLEPASPDEAPVAIAAAEPIETAAPAEEAADEEAPTAHDEPAPAETVEPAASLLPAEFESAIASAQSLAVQPQRVVAVTALSEITAANDTLAAYLRNESIATFVHWRALSTAKTPADAIRLQVNEMQRAADASLSCIASLARRAGRIAATVRRA